MLRNIIKLLTFSIYYSVIDGELKISNNSLEKQARKWSRDINDVGKHVEQVIAS